MGRLDGKTAVITGSGRGIGAIMAQHMAKEGANVVVTDVLDTSDTVAAITDGGGCGSRKQEAAAHRHASKASKGSIAGRGAASLR